MEQNGLADANFQDNTAAIAKGRKTLFALLSQLHEILAIAAEMKVSPLDAADAEALLALKQRHSTLANELKACVDFLERNKEQQGLSSSKTESPTDQAELQKSIQRRDELKQIAEKKNRDIKLLIDKLRVLQNGLNLCTAATKDFCEEPAIMQQ